MKKKLIMMLAAVSVSAVAMTGCSFNTGSFLEGVKDGYEVTTGKPDKDEDEDEDKDKPETKSETITLSSAPSEATDADYEYIYGEVLDKMYLFVTEPDVMEWDYDDGTIGVGEYAAYSSNPVDEIGYTYMDINDDGVKELIVGRTYVDPFADIDANEIFAVYSVENGTPVCIVSGWARNTHYIMEDNSFVFYASNGYASSGYGTKKYTTDGIVYGEAVYTDVAPNGEDIAVFRNPYGAWDADSAYLTDMTLEDMSDEYEQLLAKAKSISMTPFEFYAISEQEAGSFEILPVYAELASADAKADYELDTQDYAAVVNFFANSNVSELKFYKLSDKEISNDGVLSCTAELVVEHGEFKYGSELNVSMILPEITPEYAIGYVDADGVQRYYAIECSGEDGSVYLSKLVK